MLEKFSRYVVRCHLRLINVDIMRMKSHVFSVGRKGYTGSSKLTSKEYLRISNIPFGRRRICWQLLRTQFQLASMTSMSHYLVYPSRPNSADFIPSYLEIATGAKRSVR